MTWKKPDSLYIYVLRLCIVGEEPRWQSASSDSAHQHLVGEEVMHRDPGKKPLHFTCRKVALV